MDSDQVQGHVGDVELDQVQGNFEDVELDQVRGIFRRCSQTRYRCILSIRIGIDACDDGCIRSRETRSGSIGKDSSGNLWVRCRGNNIRTIERDRSGCWKNFRGDISSGCCWNRRMVNRSIMIIRDTSGRIDRFDSSSCHCK